jgi:hypothetical protein|nr:MAG TPA: hypothetical protein [Caudoviricetes sp.]
MISPKPPPVLMYTHISQVKYPCSGFTLTELHPAFVGSYPTIGNCDVGRLSSDG